MVGNILAVGLMSLGMGMSGVKDEPQMYAQDESTYTITYETSEDWQNKVNSIHNWLVENDYTSQAAALQITGSAKINETTTTLIGIYADDSSAWNYVCLVYGQDSSDKVNYYSTGNEWYTPSHQARTVLDITITSQDYYEALADSMGDSIIGSIASGLGLIGALATEFLAGFGALFYVQGALTPFAIFSLVMLGVAVSFAVVKLVLNLIRSNTGA